MSSLKDQELIKNAINGINTITPKDEVKITHICGTHEMTVSHFGIRSVIPKNIDLIPGPGCPVCVCPAKEIDLAIQIANKGHIITTFGDMLKVPSSKKSLAEVKREGRDIRIVYSPFDAVKIAKENPNREIIFFAVGFETSAPMTGATILAEPPPNFSILSAHRLTVPAMQLLLKVEKKRTNGFICPGHVSVIIGTNTYIPFSEKYKMPCVIAGFEALDMLIAILQILKMINSGHPAIINEYERAVKPKGNIKALKVINEVFDVVDANWRGIGLVEKSGLEISKKYAQFDSKKKFDIKVDEVVDIQPGCKCHEVVLGNISPPQCKLYLKKCTPENPIGPCMVSHEGTCSIYARYGSKNAI